MISIAPKVTLYPFDGTPPRSALLPTEADEFIKRFDNKREVKPFSFEIEELS